MMVLPSDSPVRYLLEGRARPNLQDEDVEAYRNGVCLGAAVVNRQRRLYESQGIIIARKDFDPEHGPVFADIPAPEPSATPFLLRSLKTAWREMNMYGEIGRYTDEGVGVRIKGALSGNVKLENLPFISEEQAKHGKLRPFVLGVSDTLRLKRQLYGGDTMSLRFGFESGSNYYYRNKKADTWPEAGLETKQDWVSYPGPPVCEVHSGYLNQQRLVAGYKAIAHERTSPSATDKIKGDIWWNNLVPAGATITDVRHFLSQHVIAGVKPDGDPKIEEVGLRGTHQKYHLGKHDVLLVRGQEDQIHAVTHPFAIDPDIVHESSGAVELLRLCSFGQSIDLIDRVRLDDAAQARFDELTQEATQGQQMTRFRRLARLLIDRGNLPDYIVGLTNSASVFGIAESFGAAQNTSLAIGGAAGAMGYVATKLYQGRKVGTYRDAVRDSHKHAC
jgi:hypothetical protein